MTQFVLTRIGTHSKHDAVMKKYLALFAPLFIACASSTSAVYSRSSIEKALSPSDSAVSTCWSKSMVPGKIKTQLEIATDGSVKNVSIQESTIKDETFHKCVSLALKNVKFSPNSSGQTQVVTWPYLFKTAL